MKFRPLRGIPALLLLGIVVAPAAPASTQDERPNILFCIADDWGWPHAGVYGDPVVRTPTFDRIAREGVLFEAAFVSSPSCTPSRNAILTGRNFKTCAAGRCFLDREQADRQQFFVWFTGQLLAPSVKIDAIDGRLT